MIRRLLRSAAVSAALVVAAGCESTPPAPIHRESLQEVRAKVVAVEKDRRLVSLQGDDGRTVAVTMGPEVRNFDQIQVGDSVVASYYESISFEVRDPALASERDAAVLGAGRAALGDKPAGAFGAAASATVTFLSYDNTKHIVTFTGQDGRAHAANVMREDGRAFAKKLNAGDRVVITASESVGVRVDPTK